MPAFLCVASLILKMSILIMLVYCVSGNIIFENKNFVEAFTLVKRKYGCGDGEILDEQGAKSVYTG